MGALASYAEGYSESARERERRKGKVRCIDGERYIERGWEEREWWGWQDKEGVGSGAAANEVQQKEEEQEEEEGEEEEERVEAAG